jgi:hypothetical protein
MAGFSPRVRKLVRTRAGSGSPFDACCEACGIHLGEHGGQIQHRLARGRGGSKDPVINGPANAALLCGTSFSGCHGDCEARHTPEAKEMLARGFWIKHGVGPEFDPRFVPLVLFGGVERWLSQDGRYLEDEPAEVAA